jgi:hypothetical protein
MKKLLIFLACYFSINMFSVSLGQTKFDVPLSPEDIWVQETINRIEYWADYLERLSPPYVWGEHGPKGGDCSGEMYWIFHMSGAPFIRTTALQMWSGTWPGYNVKTWEDADSPELIFFTYSSERPQGHVGLVRNRSDYPQKLEFDEASSGANRFKRTVMKKNSYYDRHFAGVRIPDLSVGFVKGPRKEPINLQKIPDTDPRSAQIRKMPTGLEKNTKGVKK